MKRAARVAWAAGLVLVAGCGGAPGPTTVVLVTIDTLRADRLGTYGYPRATSPHIDALARQGVVFEQATVTCPSTGPSVASILSASHRRVHGVDRNGARLRPAAQTLAEVLRAHGFRTGAVVANLVLDAGGFDQGFDRFRALRIPPGKGAPREVRGKAVVKAARRLVEEAGRAPLFLWLHFMDPHGPYVPRPRYARRFAPKEYVRPNEPPTLPFTRANYGLGVIPFYQRVLLERRPAVYRARYDAEIRQVDEAVGMVVDELARAGRFARAVVVLAADHGESLGERRIFFQHGWDVYQPTLRVPLVVVAPGRLPAGRRIAGSVSLVDVAPTILGLLGLDPPAAWEGRSLGPVIDGVEADRPAYAHTPYGNRLRVLRVGRWKYVWTPPPPVEDHRRRDGWMARWPTAAREELYDLSRDGAERWNLAATLGAERKRLRAELARWLRARARPPGSPAPVAAPIPAHVEEQLRALGYAE